MSAYLEYTWDYISPGATASVFIHGYPANWVGTYDALPFPVSGGDAYYPLFDIQLTQGRTRIHVDNTIARTVWVNNQASFNGVGVNLYFIFEAF